MYFEGSSNFAKEISLNICVAQFVIKFSIVKVNPIFIIKIFLTKVGLKCLVSRRLKGTKNLH